MECVWIMRWWSSNLRHWPLWNLGSVVNVTYCLSPSHCFRCFLYHPCHLPWPDSLPICPPLTELHRSLHPIISPLTVLDRLSTWTSAHSWSPPLPIPPFTVLPYSTFLGSLLTPASLQCEPVSAATPPFCRPPFSALGVSSVPVNPCDFSLLGSVLPPPSLKPLSPLVALDLWPVPWRSQGGSCLQFLASLFAYSCLASCYVVTIHSTVIGDMIC